MKSNIKFKILSIGLAAIAPVAVFGAISQTCISKKEDDKNFIKITFDAGIGKIVDGSDTTRMPKDSVITFGNVNKPSVTADNKIFSGWTYVDTEGNVRDFCDQELIKTNVTATANYLEPGLNCNIWFTDGGDTSVSISGNNYMEVKPGKFFFMINKPIAKKPGYAFEYWEDTNGNRIDDGYQFTANLTLRPHFKQQLNITFGQPTGVTVTYNGPTTVTVGVGDHFSTMGRPNAFAPGAKFNGWCEDQDCLKPIDESAYVFTSTSPTTLYPKMIAATERYETATYRLKQADIDAGATIQGNPQVAFLPTDPYNKFYAIPHALAICPGKSFTRWVTNTGTTEAPVWTPVTNDQVIANNTQIYAEFTTNGYVFIDGQDRIYTKSQSAAYQAKIYPASLTPTAKTWSIKSWDGSEENKPTIDATTGVVTSKGQEGQLVIKVKISLADSTEFEQTKQVTIFDPTKISSDYWIEDTTGFIKLDINSLTDPDNANITGIKSDGTVFTIARNTFNYKVKIGALVQSIPDNFLINCPSLTYAPEFVLEDGKTESNVTKIGNAFMYGDSLLNEAIIIPNSVVEIGDEFLANCSGLTKAITLPSNLIKIGSMFLMNCSSFNLDLTIPATVTDIGSYFMVNVNTFTSTLTIECSSDAFKTADLYTFSTNLSTSDHYKIGAIVTGTGSNGFKAKFPAADGTYFGEEDIYRKYKAAP